MEKYNNLDKGTPHEKLYPARSNYEIFLEVALEAVRKNGGLNPDLVNPVLEQMRLKLDNFKIVEGPLKISADTIDDFNSEEDRARGRLLISYKAKFNVRDTGPLAAERFNNYTRNRLRTGLLALKVEGKAGVIVRVIDTCFQGELKNSQNFPQDKWAMQTF